MDDISRKREKLLSLYGDSWKKRVRGMPDSQVIAVYLRLQSKGQI
jgi:hypothetical protein